DNGLLPINALLTEMEAIAAASALPSPLEQAIRRTRPWVDDALEKARFEVVHLQLLHDWLGWMQVALPLAQVGRILPDLLPARLLPDSDGALQPSGGETRLEAQPKPASLPAEEPLQMNVENDGDLLREFINES